MLFIALLHGRTFEILTRNSTLSAVVASGTFFLVKAAKIKVAEREASTCRRSIRDIKKERKRVSSHQNRLSSLLVVVLGVTHRQRGLSLLGILLLFGIMVCFPFFSEHLWVRTIFVFKLKYDIFSKGFLG